MLRKEQKLIFVHVRHWCTSKLRYSVSSKVLWRTLVHPAHRLKVDTLLSFYKFVQRPPEPDTTRFVHKNRGWEVYKTKRGVAWESPKDGKYLESRGVARSSEMSFYQRTGIFVQTKSPNEKEASRCW